MAHVDRAMESGVLFVEQQRFGRGWCLLLLPVFMVLAVAAAMGWGGAPPSVAEALAWGLPLAVLLAVLVLFVIMRLHLQVRTDGVHVRYVPFHRTYRHYPWHQVAAAHVRRYSPVAEFGGWGLRFGWAGKGRAYTVSGDRGLQLEFTDGSRLLIGTQRPKELAEVLERMGAPRP